jgi:hypothetical protein
MCEPRAQWKFEGMDELMDEFVSFKVAKKWPSSLCSLVLREHEKALKLWS